MTHARLGTALIALTLLIPLSASAQPTDGAAPDAPPAAPADTGRLLAHTVRATPAQLGQLRADDYDISATRVTAAGLELEVIMTAAAADGLVAKGLDVTLNAGQDAATAGMSFAQAEETGVFRPWSGPGNLEEEFRGLAAANPGLAQLEVIGTTIQGQEILAMRLTGTAQAIHVDDRPSVLYVSAQHAREWITPEVNRRFLRMFLDGYGTDPDLTEIMDTTQLWFVLVANPDGYDYTFSDDRLWRKNLRDNDGDGVITNNDGVDLNRNFPTNWGQDNEGSSDDTSSQVYRGTAPMSEPETVAYDALVDRIEPKLMLNIHSAANLILYGVGNQVATPTPDDVILEALAGDDANPAIPTFDPDLSAELYITNGTTTAHTTAAHDVLSFTPEQSECGRVSPDPDSCGSVFHFPDDEALIHEEFVRSRSFMLDIARSAQDPANPVSHLGNVAADIVTEDIGGVSHADNSQEVSAVVSREIDKPELRYIVMDDDEDDDGEDDEDDDGEDDDDRDVKKKKAKDWKGGDRYGTANQIYYREVRAEVKGLNVGDTVEYWFADSDGDAESEHFSFTVTEEAEKILVLANEDYDGHTPEQSLAGPAYLSYYTDALDANNKKHNVWDMDAQGAPHDLGVLSHYDTVIWYSGDNVITQDLDDRDVLFPNSEIGVADVMQDTTIAVRDFLNEGGALLRTGDNAGYFGQFVGTFGGNLYATNGDPDSPCVITSSIFDDCLLFSDDFHQYWLGDYGRVDFGEAGLIQGIDKPFDKKEFELFQVNGGSGADNSHDAGRSIVTSSILPPDQFPLIPESESVADYFSDAPSPFDPLTGEWYLGVLARNDQYNRFTRTIDLTGVSAATLDFATSYDVEGSYDFFVVEAHTVGQDDWTTLPDQNGSTPPVGLSACEDGLWDVHPFLFDHYVDGACNPVGPTGQFHAFNGSSNGWVQASMDLTPFAGGEVEVSFSYISDVGVTNTGVFIDDVVITADGVSEAQGWESDQAPWAVAPAPAGSPGLLTDWVRSMGLVDTVLSAAVATDRTIYLPFGFEAIAEEDVREKAMKEMLKHLR